MNSKPCQTAMISAYADGELGQDDAKAVRRHLERCPACRSELERLQALSGAFERAMAQQVPGRALTAMNAALIERWRHHQQGGWLAWARKAVFSKWALVPVTAALAAVAISLPFRSGPSVSQAPSVVIQSVSGEMASVMIMQTPETQQTVIWISEADDNQGNAI